MFKTPFMSSYSNCGSVMDWESCSNNCIGTKENPCIDFVPGDPDPCGLSQSGIGCYPKTCSSICAPKKVSYNHSRLIDLWKGVL